MKFEGRETKASLITFLLMLSGMLLLATHMVRPYLLSIFVGSLLALLATPVYRRLRARKLGPKLSASLVTLGIVLLVIGPIASFLAIAVKQAISVGTYLSENEVISFQSIISKLSDWGPVSSLVESTAALERQVRGGIQSISRSASGAIVALVAKLPEMGLQMALAGIACFFFLIDGRKFVAWVIDKIPIDAFVRARLVTSFKNTTISTIYATLAAAGVQAVMMFGGFLALGVPAAFLAAGATFIFAWIPVLGSVPVWTAGAIYLWTNGSVAKAIIMVVLGLLTSITDNFVRPWVLKGRGEMHPLVALVSIFGGIHMFGIFGVFVGPIIAAVLISLLEVWPVVGWRSGIETAEANGTNQEQRKAS